VGRLNVRVRVDRSRCQGHARCWAEAPDLYRLDDDGYSAVDDVEVPPGLEELARRGADACPERAIAIVEAPVP
jgi:ferredoxin